ncbi:MAG: helix-turn-helix transcriptional regulator [Bacteroidetes bacterium]|nr:helix-turn-helix transcriptional regulator [Bacteroidota bacterium]
MSATNAIKEDIIQLQILQAAQQLFQKHGIQKVNMDDVAKAIGKGRSSLYYYFKSKEEIFEAVIDAEIRDILNEIGRAMEKADGVGEKIRAFCTAKIRVARKRQSFFQALEMGMNADEMSRYAQKKQEMNRRMISEETALLRRELGGGMAAEGHTRSAGAETRAVADQRLDMVIFVLLSSLRGLKQQMFVANDFTNMDAAIDTLTRMTVRELWRE